MATKAFKTETIETMGGEELVIKPLSIKDLRKFMKVINTLGVKPDDVEEDDFDLEEHAFNVLIEATGICLRKAKPEWASNKEKLEDELDINTMHKIIEVAGGVKLNGDPNLTPAA